RPQRPRGTRRLDAARAGRRIRRARGQAPRGRKERSALHPHRHPHRARVAGQGHPPREGARRRRGHRSRLAPDGGYDPPACRPQEAAAGVRLESQGLGPRARGVHAQHDPGRLPGARRPRGSAHRSPGVRPRLLDFEDGAGEEGVCEEGLDRDLRGELVRGGFPHGARDAGPRLDRNAGHDEEEARPMTTPVTSRHLADLIAARDSSLPLAAAALARVADERGRAAFSELAIAYREEFLTLRAHSREAGLPELGGLSVEEFRTSLRTSVLPRLALMNVVTYGTGALGDAAPIAFTVEAWGEIAADRAASADRLLDTAE